MRIPLYVLLCALLLVPAAARADDHRADWYGGVSGGNGASKLFGVHQTFIFTTPWVGKNLSVVAGDVSVQTGSHDGKKARQTAFMSGVRFTVAERDHHSKFSGHVLLGTVVSYREADPTTPALTDTSGAFAVGASYEFLKHPISSEPAKAFGIRGQVDYIVRVGDQQNFWRVSGGVIYRFGQHEKP